MLGEVLNAPLLILKFSYPKASIINNLRYSKPLCSNWVLKDLIIFAHMITSCFFFISSLKRITAHSTILHFSSDLLITI